MFEIILVVWLVVYALWLLAFVVMGETQHALRFTVGYVFTPLLGVFAIFVSCAIVGVAPFVLFFSKEARNAVSKKLNERN